MDLSKEAGAAIEAGLNKAIQVIQGHLESRQSEFKALAASTIVQRRSEGYGATPILIRSGTLKAHLADERQVTTTATGAKGYIAPSKSAKPDYGERPISEYIGALDDIRPFYDFDDSGDEDAIAEAMLEGFIEAWNG